MRSDDSPMPSTTMCRSRGGGGGGGSGAREGGWEDKRRGASIQLVELEHFMDIICEQEERGMQSMVMCHNNFQCQRQFESIFTSILIFLSQTQVTKLEYAENYMQSDRIEVFSNLSKGFRDDLYASIPCSLNQCSKIFEYFIDFLEDINNK